MDNESPAYSVRIEPAAWREITALPASIQQQIFTAIERLEVDPRPSGVVKLAGQENYRIRSADYRILYKILDEVLVVLVVKVAHRREAYRKKK